MIPQRVHTMHGPKVGTGTSLDHGSALMIARRWQFQQDTSSEQAPLVMGSIRPLKPAIAVSRPSPAAP
jgi:hypothetical protein